MEHSISVTVADRDVTLLFGMTAVRIWQERTTSALLAVKNDSTKVDPFHAFVSCVYGGMCNYEEANERPFPDYKEAYLIADAIALSEDDKMQDNVWICFSNSRAYERMIKRLNELTGKQKKSANEKTTSRRGSKSK